MSEIKTVAVIGAGTMGRGIAQVSALAGYNVVLYDIGQEIVEEAFAAIKQSIDKGVARGKTAADVAEQAKAAFTLTTSLTETSTADLIIEGAPEKLELKRNIFRQLDELAAEQTIIASNTSSLSIGALAGATKRPSNVIGLHFFNPAHIMKLVEIIPSDLTSAESVQSAREYVEKIGKVGVLAKDTPAFIVNRVARPFYGEAFRILGEGQADAATIDKLMQSMGFRMGPFELIDLIGCDVNFAVTQSVYNAYFQDPKFRPHPIQQQMVESGRLGRKTGRGFYDYSK
ncbi:MAG: 3-hydroxybutyryl-CoA dehydrogenase [Anaerolineales bacterium]|nr:3-hydroxybutyryl-CoA dehydrogenase [Anaerolineales bacterium]